MACSYPAIKYAAKVCCSILVAPAALIQIQKNEAPYTMRNERGEDCGGFDLSGLCDGRDAAAAAREDTQQHPIRRLFLWRWRWFLLVGPEGFEPPTKGL